MIHSPRRTREFLKGSLNSRPSHFSTSFTRFVLDEARGRGRLRFAQDGLRAPLFTGRPPVSANKHMKIATAALPLIIPEPNFPRRTLTGGISLELIL